MKTSIYRLLPMVFILVLANACMVNSINGNGEITEKTYNTGPYDQIEIRGGMDATLVEGNEGSISVEADENLMEYLDLSVSNGRLVIDFDHNGGFNSNHGIKITVPIQDIDAAIVSGSGSITSDLKVNSEEFKSIISGSGDIMLTVNSAKQTAVVSGSGDIKLNGKTEKISATVSGSGEIDASDLAANDATATISGSGDIFVWMNGGTLNATITGSGDITYRGKISDQKTKIVGSGDLNKTD